MPPVTRLRWLSTLTVAAWLLVLSPAHAYIDPGSGSLIFSWIVAGLAAAGMTLRIFWSRIRGLFRRGDEDAARAAATADQKDDAPRVGADSD